MIGSILLLLAQVDMTSVSKPPISQEIFSHSFHFSLNKSLLTRRFAECSLYSIHRSLTVFFTNILLAVPRQTLEQDSGVYLLMYTHGYLSFHDRIHTSTDNNGNSKSLLSSSSKFIFYNLMWIIYVQKYLFFYDAFQRCM